MPQAIVSLLTSLRLAQRVAASGYSPAAEHATAAACLLVGV